MGGAEQAKPTALTPETGIDSIGEDVCSELVWLIIYFVIPVKGNYNI